MNFIEAENIIDRFLSVLDKFHITNDLDDNSKNYLPTYALVEYWIEKGVVDGSRDE